MLLCFQNAKEMFNSELSDATLQLKRIRLHSSSNSLWTEERQNVRSLNFQCIFIENGFNWQEQCAIFEKYIRFYNILSRIKTFNFVTILGWQTPPPEKPGRR